MLPERLPRGSGGEFGVDLEVLGGPWETHFGIFLVFFLSIVLGRFLEHFLDDFWSILDLILNTFWTIVDNVGQQWNIDLDSLFTVFHAHALFESNHYFRYFFMILGGIFASRNSHRFLIHFGTILRSILGGFFNMFRYILASKNDVDCKPHFRRL